MRISCELPAASFSLSSGQVQTGTVGGELGAGFRIEIKLLARDEWFPQVTPVIVKTKHVSAGNAICAELWYNATANYACLHRSVIKALEFQTWFFYHTKVWRTKTPINLSVESRRHGNTASEEEGISCGLTAGRRNKDKNTTNINLKDTLCLCRSTAGLLTGWGLSPQTHKNTTGLADILGQQTTYEYIQIQHSAHDVRPARTGCGCEMSKR